MSLSHAILGFLKDGPMSGYDLKTRCFDSMASPFWTADQAQVYRTLERLENDDLVDSRLVTQRGKPDRRSYSITPFGSDELTEWLSTPQPQAPLRDPFLLKLLFADAIDGDALVEVLRRARDEHQDRLDALRARTRSLPGDGPREMAMLGAVTKERCTIDWLDDCIQKATEAGRSRR